MIFRIIAASALTLILVLGICVWWLQHDLSTPYFSSGDPEVFVEIPKGATTRNIAELLADAGVLRNRLPFVVYLRWTGEGRRLQAGEYRFSGPATPPEIIHRLIRGDVFFNTITIPEGLTAHEIIDLIASSKLADAVELENLLGKTAWIRDLAPAAGNLEGYLFPDTYRLPRKAGSEDILKAMTDQFKEKMKKILAEHPLPEGWNIAGIVTLASMVEKEVKTASERPLVASVLRNRLEKGMPLGCDPTVIYALKIAGKFDGNIRKPDLRISSPYNTYVHTGLPPGPIASPGADSLIAALSPAKTEYLYFVSRNDGTHQFSRDFKTHQAAVQQYQGRRTLAKR